jgi:hypothetical protein
LTDFGERFCWSFWLLKRSISRDPISTYVWIVTNRKPKARKGKVQLVNGVELFQKMRKSLGNKRNELGKTHCHFAGSWGHPICRHMGPGKRAGTTGGEGAS